MARLLHAPRARQTAQAKPKPLARPSGPSSGCTTTRPRQRRCTGHKSSIPRARTACRVCVHFVARRCWPRPPLAAPLPRGMAGRSLPASLRAAPRLLPVRLGRYRARGGTPTFEHHRAATRGERGARRGGTDQRGRPHKRARPYRRRHRRPGRAPGSQRRWPALPTLPARQPLERRPSADGVQRVYYSLRRVVGPATHAPNSQLLLAIAGAPEIIAGDLAPAALGVTGSDEQTVTLAALCGTLVRAMARAIRGQSGAAPRHCGRPDRLGAARSRHGCQRRVASRTLALPPRRAARGAAPHLARRANSAAAGAGHVCAECRHGDGAV